MTIKIYELVYNPSKGRDVAVEMKVDYNPRKYADCASAAKGLHAALCKLAKAKYDYSEALAQSEILLFDPERSVSYNGSPVWHVVWESGPYDWAVSAFISGPWGHCEPYHGFDLGFFER